MTTTPAFCKDYVLTNIKVIHASTGKNYLDPSLKQIIPELESIFRYTSYKLLKTQSLNQRLNREDKINLPGKRSLVITPLDSDKKKIRYQINILKNQHSVFHTVILLKNNRSITIGGPKFKNGNLLFNISGTRSK